MKQIPESLFTQKQIDRNLTYEILEAINRKTGKPHSGSESFTFPRIDGRVIFDAEGEVDLQLPLTEVSRTLKSIDPALDPAAFADVDGDTARFDSEGLERLGLQLMQYVAFGVLNGGSATSYVDGKKNADFYPPLSEIIREPFDKLADLSAGEPKGLTPAYLNPDGTPGYSFMELKMRALLLLELKAGTPCRIPLFQMTSNGTHDQLLAAYDEYRQSDLLAELIETTGHDVTRARSAKQPLIAAFTPASEGSPRDVFTSAHGKENNLLPLPGGHGQNFLVLKDIYRQLHREGKKFAYLVNVDNIGNVPSPLHIALTALSGCQGSFEFSYKSPIDIKGGVLLKDEQGDLTCRDIGVAISKEDVAAAEETGKPVLFNCATGLFNLDYLDAHLEQIIEKLPLRVSEQKKDAGEYAQAEQVTWEIIDLMEQPAILAVSKHERFLAAKLLSESIMTTGASRIVPQLLARRPDYRDFCEVSLELEKGFTRMMDEVYQMKLEDGRWKPRRLDELKA